MDHFVAAAEVRVLVGDRVEAMRAARDDLGDAGFVQRLDVLLGEGLEHVLVADPAGGIAGAALAGAEDREVDAGSLQQLAVAAALLRARSSNEPRSRPSRGTRGRGRPVRESYPEVGRPVGALDWAFPHGFEARSIRGASARPRPGSSTRPSRDAGAGRRSDRRARSRPGTPAARAAGHAVPHHVGGNRLGDERFRCRGRGRGPEPHDHELRRQDLAGGERGACVLAAPALGARERVEHLLPGEVFGHARSEAELVLGDVGIVELERFQPALARCVRTHVGRGEKMCRCLERGR